MPAASADVSTVGQCPARCQAHEENAWDGMSFARRVDCTDRLSKLIWRGLMKQRVGIALAVLALIAPAAFAQAKKSGQAGKSSAAAQSAGAADQAFAKEAAAGGLAEVALGTLAKDKASNADVKAFGDRMVTDHSKANDELKQWASSKNVTLPSDLDAKAKATQDRLSKLSGDAFDKAYMKDMVADHKTDVAAFKKESTSG